jgi:glycosyltransferase involved in cell wall biosynthesis
MHIVDSLTAAGRERMAVNLVNALPRTQFTAYLCTTRQEGPLAELVAKDVGRLRLHRRWRYDLMAVYRLVAFNQAHGIHILHAHDASLFLAVLAAFFPPYPAVVWHDHYGQYLLEERPVWLYRPPMKRVSAVIAVNQPLVAWSRRRLGVPGERVCYIPNFVCTMAGHETLPALPGASGQRIVCVANLRAQKDHLTLLRAMALIIRQVPTVHLLLLGAASEPEYSDMVRREIVQQGLQGNITCMGSRQDVYAILPACDIGVLSSASEGLPLALIEYGMAKLAAVATNVGQCAEVLDDGRAGLLVPPASPQHLAAALLSLLACPARRQALGRQLYRRVQERYSPGPVMEQVCQVYAKVLQASQAPGR